MKKVLIIILITISSFSFFMFNNDYIDITHMAYITSLGLEYNDKTSDITLSSYILSNFTISKSDYNTSTSNDSATIIKTTGKTIEEVIFNLISCTSVKMDFSHVETLVINTSFNNGDNILNLINYLGNSRKFYPKFNIFITDEVLKDIYNIKYFNDTSSYYTLLSEGKGDKRNHYASFLELANDFLVDDYFVMYPSLKILKNINEKESGISLLIDGYYYFNRNKLNKIIFNDYPMLSLLFSTNNNTFNINDNLYIINSYRNKEVKIFNKMYLLYYLKSTYSKSIKDELLKFIIFLYNKDIDVYNLKYYKIDISNITIIGVEKNISKIKEVVN